VDPFLAAPLSFGDVKLDVQSLTQTLLSFLRQRKAFQLRLCLPGAQSADPSNNVGSSVNCNYSLQHEQGSTLLWGLLPGFDSEHNFFALFFRRSQTFEQL